MHGHRFYLYGGAGGHQEAAREFAEKEFTPELARECDREEKFPWELWKKCAKLGFHAVDIPEEYGGGGYGPIEKMIVMEEFSAVNPGLGLACVIPTFGFEILLLHGSEEQKEKWLPKLAKGEVIMGMANTEPDAGSDAANIKTRAVRREMSGLSTEPSSLSAMAR